MTSSPCSHDSIEPPNVKDDKNDTVSSIETPSSSERFVCQSSTEKVAKGLPKEPSINTLPSYRSEFNKASRVEDNHCSSASFSPVSEEQFQADTHQHNENEDIPSIETNKLNGRFLDVQSLCDLLQSESTAMPSIPKGIKEDVFFLIENSDNVLKRLRGEVSNFEDDCGVWNSKVSSTKKTIFHHVNGKFKAIEMRDGKYCTKKLKDWVPLEPQPLDEEVMILKRFYTSLKRKSDYKKRITWIEKMSSQMDIACHGKAVAEYLGLFPSKTSMHGNSKKGSGSEYVRTSESTKKKIANRITNAPPRNIYCDMVLEDSVDAPRDLKQVQNIKQANARKQRVPAENRKNIADDVQTIINRMNDRPFIQEVIQTKGKPPMVILYTEDQVKDVKNFCVTNRDKSILGVDRTFNLGACFVTLTVFKNTHLLRRSTQSPPIMLGQLFLHWDGSCVSYQRFFSHLRTKFDANINTEMGFCDIVIGSDEEKAIMKAVQQSFPSATQLLCQRHLEENVRRYLQHKVGVPDKVKKDIVSLIFGNDGLINAKDLVEFELKVLSLSNTVLDAAPNFVDYFENSLVPRVREYIFKPKLSASFIPINWTNNNCESLNNILKLSTNWKVLKLPDLIEKMYSIVKLQYADMRRALHGHGNYQVVPKLKSFVLSNAAWCQKSEDEKSRHLQRFISVSNAKKDNVIISTDGELKIPKTTSIARKPGQRKRVRTERTRTQKRKKTD